MVFNQMINQIDFGLGILFLILVPLFIIIYVTRKFYSLPFILLYAGIIVSYYFFQFRFLTFVLIFLFALLVYIFVEFNMIDIKALIDNLFKFKQKKIVQTADENQKVYQEINEAVGYLSKTKTGAIITLEKKQNLNEFMKNGVEINAPISSELIMTIFFQGTRLHDGAIVVRNGLIIAASVYYTPTTKPMAGKYGSRHRAAIGISELSDSVTVVVSEETGRISIAYGGELEAVFHDNFQKVLVHYMEANTSN
jgi:diadenylate cyclase